MDYVKQWRVRDHYCLEAYLSVSDDVMYFCKLFFQYLSFAEHLDSDD